MVTKEEVTKLLEEAIKSSQPSQPMHQPTQLIASTPGVSGWQQATPQVTIKIESVSVPLSLSTPDGELRCYLNLSPEVASSPNTLLAEIPKCLGKEIMAKVKITNKDATGKDELYEMWYKCPKCSQRWISIEFKYCPGCGKEIIWKILVQHCIR
jgi:hypothetical protein